MTIKKLPTLKYYDFKLPIILTIILLFTMINPEPIFAKNKIQSPINSKFGSYLAGRQAQFDTNPRFAIRYYQSALKKSPNNILLLRKIVTLLISDGRIEEALVKANQLHKISDNKFNISNIILILAEIKKKNFKGAFDDLDKLPEGGLNDYLLPMLKAWLLAGQKKNDDALKLLDQKSNNPGLETLYSLQGALISEFTGKNNSAINRHLASMKLRKTENLQATVLLGNLYERLGKNQKAKALYDRYKRLRPTTTMLDYAYERLKLSKKPKPNIKTTLDGIAEALFSLSFAIQNQNSYQAIIFAQLAIYMRPSFTLAKLLLAESLEDNENLAEANYIYRNISNDPKYARVARLRMANNLDLLGDTTNAIKELQIMSMEKKERVDALIELGNILQRNKRYQASINAYEQAKKRIPNFNKQNWPLYFSLGISYERVGKWQMAEKNLLKALKLRPNHPSILNYIGYSWVEQGLQLDKAQEMIRRAVKQRPRDGYIIDSLGWVLYRLGNINGAVKQLERAVLIRPEDPTINDHLGDIYWSIGRRNEAKFQWNRALILKPEKDQIPIIKRKLEVGLPEDANTRYGK